MSGLVQRSYDVVRPYLPRRLGTYRGYVARDDRLLDATTARPHYKQGLVEGLHEHAPGSDVAVVGFGRGVSSMIALEAGASSVTAYEAASEMIELGLESFALNDVPADDLTVQHAVVGEPVDVYGTSDGADVVAPDALSPCDVLVLDCEGAELSILEDLSTAPDATIVETHPGKGAPTEDVRDALDGLDCAVERRRYEPDVDHKHVLVGTA